MKQLVNLFSVVFLFILPFLCPLADLNAQNVPVSSAKPKYASGRQAQGKSDQTNKKTKSGNRGITLQEKLRQDELKRKEEERQASESLRIEEQRSREEAERLDELKRQEEDQLRRQWQGSYDAAQNEIIYGTHRYKLVYVPGGSFTMGATKEQGRVVDEDEKNTHDVTLGSFYLGATEVPQWLWVAVMRENPSNFRGDNLPVERVSWEACQEFIKRLNMLTGQNFRLPTEAEWEFAARERTSLGTKFSGGRKINEVAWYKDNSDGKTHDVGSKSPNSLGLYDMSGNVNEWCEDRYGEYPSSPQTNPTGADSGVGRVTRGGSWFNFEGGCRVSNRNSNNGSSFSNDTGFRLAM